MGSFVLLIVAKGQTPSHQQRLDHIVLDAARLTNPLRVANYQEEDLVGRIKRILSCHIVSMTRANMSFDPTC